MRFGRMVTSSISRHLLLVASGAAALVVAGCGSSDEGVEVHNPLTNPEDGPPAGNTVLPDGAEDCTIVEEAGLADVSDPKTVIGDGTPESCTSEAVIDAIAGGGVITFDCGDDAITITLDEPAKIVNDSSDEIVIDGGGKVTLSGGGEHRILYMNTCDEDQVWLTSHCQDQELPSLVVQNLTFIDGNTTSTTKQRGDLDGTDGGGAIFVRGGRFRVINSRFFNNHTEVEGPDVGGGAIRVLSQYDREPVYVVNCTFGGEDGFGNTGSNGGALSSISVDWTIINSYFSHNVALGEGANPAQSGTPGGGSGGAIYNDGVDLRLKLCGTTIENNQVNEHGGAIFFVDNDHNGVVDVESSILRNNPGGTWYPVVPGISMHSDDKVNVDDVSIIEE